MNYQKIYNSLIERGKNRIVEGYTEKHHIVPKCMGGDDSEDNLVKLTPEEHYLAHQLLVKIYPNNKKLVFGARQMTMHGGHLKRNNKMYGWLRKKHSESAKNFRHDEKTKLRISETKRLKPFVYTDEIREKMSMVALGKKHTEEAKKKCSEAGKKAKGILKTEEHKQALKLAAKNRPRATCEHCGKEVQVNMYHRWHGNKCKQK